MKELIHFVKTGRCHGSEKLMTEKVVAVLTRLDDPEFVEKHLGQGFKGKYKSCVLHFRFDELKGLVIALLEKIKGVRMRYCYRLFEKAIEKEVLEVKESKEGKEYLLYHEEDDLWLEIHCCPWCGAMRMED